MTTVTEATAIVPAAAGAPVPGQQGPAPAPESSLTASPTTVSFVAQAALSQAASTPPPHGSPKSAAAADPQPVPISTDSTKPVPAPGTETTIVIEPAPAIAPAPPPVVLKLVPEDLSAGSTLPDVVAKEEPHRPPTPTASPKSLFEADKAPEPAPNPVVSTETAKTSNFAQNFFIILGTVGILTTLGGAGLLYFSSIIPTIVAGIPLLQAMGVAKIVAIAKVLPMIGGSMITLASISLLLTGMRASKKS